LDTYENVLMLVCGASDESFGLHSITKADRQCKQIRGSLLFIGSTEQIMNAIIIHIHISTTTELRGCSLAIRYIGLKSSGYCLTRLLHQGFEITCGSYDHNFCCTHQKTVQVNISNLQKTNAVNLHYAAKQLI